MAKIEAIIPFILHFEAGVNKKYLGLPNEQIFEIAKKTGFANDPVDAGGATMCGTPSRHIAGRMDSRIHLSGL